MFWNVGDCKTIESASLLQIDNFDVHYSYDKICIGPTYRNHPVC